MSTEIGIPGDIENNSTAPSSPLEGTVKSDTEHGRPSPVKAGLCWQTLKNKPCKFGDQCKNHHLSLEQVLSKMTLQDGDAMEVDLDKKLTLDVEKKLNAGLYKTKLCSLYQTRSCTRGSRCTFIHMIGPDAKSIVAHAIASKLCPWESNLDNCLQRICFFKHEKRESTPADPLGKPYKKNDGENVYKIPARTYRYFRSDGIDIKKPGDWRRKSDGNSPGRPSQNDDAASDLIKFEEIDD